MIVSYNLYILKEVAPKQLITLPAKCRWNGMLIIIIIVYVCLSVCLQTNGKTTNIDGSN